MQRFEGRKFDYTPRNRFEEEYARYSTQEVERIRNDVVMDALSAVSIRMGAMRQGRKSIIFVSEGFTVQLPPQMQRQNGQNEEWFGSNQRSQPQASSEIEMPPVGAPR